MTSEKRQQISVVANWFQVATMVIGFGGTVYALGAKGEQLEAARRDMDKLAATVADLARTQTASAATNAATVRGLEDIQRRLDAIERRIERSDR